jgi:hypothetical protein
VGFWHGISLGGVGWDGAYLTYVSLCVFLPAQRRAEEAVQQILLLHAASARPVFWFPLLSPS